MKTHRFSVSTGSSRQIVDITGEVSRFVREKGDGLLNISVPHATAGLVIMELGSGSEADLWNCLDQLMPRDRRYVHSHGSKGHGADHLLPAFLAPTLTLPVVDGRVLLGTWQSIAMVDPNVDNPERELLLAFLPSSS
ncbi:MAG: secondary thiamine-phosphate synthase enzyme YjbQ [Actinomycetota bacterium]|nr:secondary thiamine-phosphate synthase enzyme YjbQ [Actinomycetota bacterium]